jgi:peroxiredoxin
MTMASNAEVKSQWKLDFPVLSDQGNNYARQLSLVQRLPDDLQAVYREFGIDLPGVNGDDSWELPLATRMVIDQQGVIRRLDTDPDYTRRPEVETSLEAIRMLG